MNGIAPSDTSRAKATVFADLNTFAHENFTSGLLIVVRDFLRAMSLRGSAGSIVSVAECSKAYDAPSAKEGYRLRYEQDIPIHETLLGYDLTTQNFDITGSVFRNEFKRLHPKTILLNSPAVFLSEAHIVFLDEVLKSNAHVKYFICDGLFPSPEGVNASIREKYLDLVRKTEPFAISRIFQEKFAEIVNKAIAFLPTPFNKDSIVIESDYVNRKYITLVNHHPIKGRAIFNEIARSMPDKQFLIVESWPDCPEYETPSPNVTFKKFHPDVRDIWKQTRILLVPSLWSEGRARVVTEAMLNGIPVVACSISSLPELASEGLFLVDPPEIKGYELVGNVLFPQIEDSELKLSADRFIKEIERIDDSRESWEGQSNAAKISSEKYYAAIMSEFGQLCDYWIKENGNI